MGTAGYLIGGAVLGIGAASMNKMPSYGMPTEVASNMAPSMPEAPMAPNPAAAATGSDSGATENALMEAERARARQQALLRRQQSREVFTSGLGAAGLAETAKKSLLGG